VVEFDAMVVLTDADQRRPDVPKRGDRAGVRRQLHQDDVAGIDEHARQQVESLL